jgi:hypothetical protein
MDARDYSGLVVHGFVFYSPAVEFISTQMVYANDSLFKVSTALGSISVLLEKEASQLGMCIASSNS